MRLLFTAKRDKVHDRWGSREQWLVIRIVGPLHFHRNWPMTVRPFQLIWRCRQMRHQTSV